MRLDAHIHTPNIDVISKSCTYVANAGVTHFVAITSNLRVADVLNDLGARDFMFRRFKQPMVVDDVRSLRVKVLLDPVNMMNHRTVYNTTAFLNNTFDLLEDVIIGAHAKDVSLDPSHWVIKIDELPPGKGSLDYETFLLRMSQLDQDTVLTIEHLRDVGEYDWHREPNERRTASLLGRPDGNPPGSKFPISEIICQT